MNKTFKDSPYATCNLKECIFIVKQTPDQIEHLILFYIKFSEIFLLFKLSIYEVTRFNLKYFVAHIQVWRQYWAVVKQMRLVCLTEVLIQPLDGFVVLDTVLNPTVLQFAHLYYGDNNGIYFTVWL